MQFGIAQQGRLDIPQAMALPDLSHDQGEELAPARQGIAAERSVLHQGQPLEFKSRYRLEELREYRSMVGNSPIPLFDSTSCDKPIVSKRRMESGYLVELNGTAVGTSPIVPEATVHASNSATNSITNLR